MTKGIKILLFFYCISYSLFGQSHNIEFEHLTTKDGLSNNVVTSIIQDSSGFMWFGTGNGLNRWDGYNFKTYLHDPNDSSSISNNQIQDLFIDHNGNMWVGTSNGLNKFDYGSSKFERYTARYKDSDQYPYNVIKDIIEDRKGIIWCATMYGLSKLDSLGKLYYYVPEPKNTGLLSPNDINSICLIEKNTILLGTEGGLLKYNIDTNNFLKLPFNDSFFDRWPTIYKIYKDRSGQLWLGMAGRDMGLLKYNYKDRSFKQYRSDPSNPNTLSHPVIQTIGEDLSGNLWVGTIIGGLNLLDRATDQFQSFRHNSLDEKSIGSQWILAIFEDNDHNLWFGTEDNGVSYVKKNRKPLINFAHNTEDSSSLASGEITAICEDKQGDLWIAHWGGGVSRLKKGSNNFIRYIYNPSHKISISNEWVSDVYEDKEGQIWVASMGLDRINPKTNSEISYRHDINNHKSLGGFRVTTIYEDNTQRLWLSFWEGGLDLFDKKQKTFKHFKHDPMDSMSICGGEVLSILQDSKNILWFGTTDGLCRLDSSKINKVEFITYKNVQTKIGTISGNIITKIFKDSKNRLWIGTSDGLNLFNYENESFTRYTTKDGLPSNSIYAILEDDHGNLWLRTEKRLVKFNVEKKSFRIYDESDGFPDCMTSQIGYKAFYKSRSGKFYYGGKNSITVFYPDSIKDNSNPPQIVLTDFKLRNKSVEISDSSYLKKDINYISSIELPYHENIFSIEYAALDYTTPAKNQYAYKLEGFNNDWTYTNADHRIASYTNLDPGEYTFRVIGTNCDGVWNKVGATVNIIILPPWWATWWFRSITIILLISGLIFLYKLRINHLKLEKVKQEEFSKKLIESQEGERKRIAGELHDSLGQNLMIIYNELQQYSQKKEITPTELKSLFPEVKETIEEVREIARNLHPHQLEQLGLTKAIISIVKKLSSSTKIIIHSNIQFVDEFLSSDQWIHVYRIVQEALTNIIKHSEATEVKIELKRNPKNIFMLIEDNGIGIQSIIEKTKNGFGLENLKERARLLNAKLEISSPLQQGVKVKMSIPLKTI